MKRSTPWLSLQHLTDARALEAGAASVDQANLSEAVLGRCPQVPNLSLGRR